MMEARMSRRAALGRLVLAPATTMAALLAAFPSQDAHAQGAGGECRPTRTDALGPFHLPGAPHRAAIAPPGEPGDRLVIRGQVLQPDCKTPLAGALLDVWQADASGNYHDERTQYRLRGRLATSQTGKYELFSILPGRYRAGGGVRPAHIHLIVTQPGYRPLTTQIYFKGDPYLAPNDACGSGCASDDTGRVIELRKEEKMGAEFLAGTFDIVLQGA